MKLPILRITLCVFFCFLISTNCQADQGGKILHKAKFVFKMEAPLLGMSSLVITIL
jgi:hypothetical protein